MHGCSAPKRPFLVRAWVEYCRCRHNVQPGSLRKPLTWEPAPAMPPPDPPRPLICCQSPQFDSAFVSLPQEPCPLPPPPLVYPSPLPPPEKNSLRCCLSSKQQPFSV